MMGERERGRGIGKKRRMGWQWKSSDENEVIRGVRVQQWKAARAAAMRLQGQEYGNESMATGEQQQEHGNGSMVMRVQQQGSGMPAARM